MNHFIYILVASSFLLTACGKSEDRKSTSSPVAPTVSQSADGDEASGTVKPNPDDVLQPWPELEGEGEGEQQQNEKKPEEKKPVEKKPVEKKPVTKPAPEKKPVRKPVPGKRPAPGSEAPQKETKKETNKGYETTGAKADAHHEYISLLNDGLMSQIKSRTGHRSANIDFAGTLLNGRLEVDRVTQDIFVTVNVNEGGFVRAYSYSVVPTEGRMVEMRRDRTPNYGFEGQQDIRASLNCLDGSGRCRTAVMKLTRVAKGSVADAYVVFRKAPAIIDVFLGNPETTNASLLDLHQFIINKAVVHEGDFALDTISVESFEVAYGISMVRTVLTGKNREVIGHVSPLLTSNGSVNWKMRGMHVATDNLDMADIRGMSTKLASTIGSANLRRADGQGLITVTYRMRSSTNAKDELTLKYNVAPQALLPVSF